MKNGENLGGGLTTACELFFLRRTIQCDVRTNGNDYEKLTGYCEGKKFSKKYLWVKKIIAKFKRNSGFL